uniref:cell growth regulator with EF hand domain protein 1 n=1 Tax=Doryrhamphus excisus TaxID=161450 RepID=UPI0025AE3F0C|nr:cell growth regulator with EF hand domain protein 1 [Doryrhamphus excisus]XP_057945067.1 cell growth regulator with EF hand domain protein 1 [Doryrhamphus excisus]XP_057945068.1 cell growth regulator with EF hand domain protein 1 [Doryrhamphus excisus]
MQHYTCTFLFLTSTDIPGVIMETHLSRRVPCLVVLVLVLYVHLSHTAPGLTGSQREDPENVHPIVLTNPFGSGEEERRLLQRYIELSRKDGEEIKTWEQEVFYLFHLYDYDHSGLLDGLEMMKLLSDYNSQHALDAQVVSMVDLLLQTQDVNQDGLLAPSELLSPSITQIEKVPLDERPSDVGHDQEIVEEKQDPGEHVQPQAEVQEDARAKVDELIRQVDEHIAQQVPEAFAAEHGGHEQEVLAHQEQQEM